MTKQSIITWILILATTLITSVKATDVSQTNVSGGNTSIQGGYSSATTYEAGSSSSSTTTNNSTSNLRSSPNGAYAPAVNTSGVDVCSVGISAGVQTFNFGLSGGKGVRDLNCERIKLSRELSSNGMKVAAVAILCQDERVFEAMEQAGSPCPFQGKIGKEATQLWKTYNKLRPDYNLYTNKLKLIEDQKKKDELKFVEEFKKVEEFNKVIDNKSESK